MTDAVVTPFEEDPARRPADTADFVVDIEGFEGPIDLLLVLARQQKVDLTQISILQLAEQYLEFIQHARAMRLELAADYLVMAAWLAYLKSRLLLPVQEDGDEPSGEELAAALAFQLQRLEAMRDVGQKLFARDLLGRDVFGRGAPEVIAALEKPIFAVTFNDLLQAYADQRQRVPATGLHIPALELFSIEAAVKRLSAMIGTALTWSTLEGFLPRGLSGELLTRSALASTFAASLELAREGALDIRQAAPFAPIFVRRRPEQTE